MTCGMCGAPADGDLCAECSAEGERQRSEIDALMEGGCSYHCAAGQVYGGQHCVLTVGGQHSPWHTMNPRPEPVELRAEFVRAPVVDVRTLWGEE